MLCLFIIFILLINVAYFISFISFLISFYAFIFKNSIDTHCQVSKWNIQASCSTEPDYICPKKTFGWQPHNFLHLKLFINFLTWMRFYMGQSGSQEKTSGPMSKSGHCSAFFFGLSCDSSTWFNKKGTSVFKKIFPLLKKNCIPSSHWLQAVVQICGGQCSFKTIPKKWTWWGATYSLSLIIVWYTVLLQYL